MNCPLELTNEIMRGFAPALPIAPIPNAPADDEEAEPTTTGTPVTRDEE